VQSVRKRLHVDLQIACEVCGDGRLLVRASRDGAMTQWLAGAEVGIFIDADGCAAFPLQP
jgi:hypothetical protein